MSAVVLALIQIGLKIAAARLSGNAAEIAKIPGLVIEMAQSVNKLSVEEVGKPIDWASLPQHHDHI